MADDLLVKAMEIFSLLGILVAGVIFVRLAVKARNIGSFRFQLSIFILIWVAAEIPQIAETLGLITVGSLDVLGLAFHMTSMFTFAIFVGARTFKFLRIQPVPPLPKPARPTLPTGAIESE